MRFGKIGQSLLVVAALTVGIVWAGVEQAGTPSGRQTCTQDRASVVDPDYRRPGICVLRG